MTLLWLKRHESDAIGWMISADCWHSPKGPVPYGGNFDNCMPTACFFEVENENAVGRQTHSTCCLSSIYSCSLQSQRHENCTILQSERQQFVAEAASKRQGNLILKIWCSPRGMVGYLPLQLHVLPLWLHQNCKILPPERHPRFWPKTQLQNMMQLSCSCRHMGPGL